MANKIQTINDAFRICTNHVRLVGLLNELSVATNRHGDNIVVSYVGIVIVNDSYIKIHGKTTSSSPRFKSDVERLSELKANMNAKFTDGELVSTDFSDECSLVYIEGSISSSRSVRAGYICTSDTDSCYMLGTITGVPVEIVNDNTIKVLIINNHFHNVITLKCNRYGSALQAMLNQTISFSIKTHNNINETPLSLVYTTKLADEIPQSVIDSALMEHDIYIATRNNE